MVVVELGWIRRFAPADDAGIRLVCLPHAGGSASFYFPYATALSPGIDVLAVQYPGRQDRMVEPLIDNIPELADGVTVALRPWLDRPFALFGHSMGGSVAFEVAGRLQRDGIVPRHLFVSGRQAPSCPREEDPLYRKDDAAIIAEMTTMSGTDERILQEPELLAMVLPVMRNDYRAAETYRHDGAPPLTCPITALNGVADHRTNPDDVRAWRIHTMSTFDYREYPGGHFFLMDNQSAILDLVTDRLRAAAVPGGEGS